MMLHSMYFMYFWMSLHPMTLFFYFAICFSLSQLQKYMDIVFWCFNPLFTTWGFMSVCNFRDLPSKINFCLKCHFSREPKSLLWSRVIRPFLIYLLRKTSLANSKGDVTRFSFIYSCPAFVILLILNVYPMNRITQLILMLYPTACHSILHPLPAMYISHRTGMHWGQFTCDWVPTWFQVLHQVCGNHVPR